MNEEKSIFDEVELQEELAEDTSESLDEELIEEEVFKPIVSKESPKQQLERRGVRKKMDGKIITIKSYDFTKPKTKNFDGTEIPPKPCENDPAKLFYGGKLVLRFEEESLIEYYPNFKYFVRPDGSINREVKIFRAGKNAVANLFNLAVDKMGRPADEISDDDFYGWLKGKKVKIKTEEGVHKGKPWFRNDIEQFVD